MPPGRAFLIDGTAFCYRAFYAIRSLATSQGRPTNAVYGFAVMLKALREQRHPEYLAVAFDAGKPTFRHRRFAEYKIQRKPMPDSLIEQLSTIKALLKAYRVPTFEQEGYEGEDLLATIATRIAARSIEVFLVSGDKDVLQLVNARIKVYNPHRQQDDPVVDAAAVKARYGVPPERIVDLMALMGDEIDNIPGVAGIGEKTARSLLSQFNSLDQLYRHLDDVDSPSRRKLLAASKEQAELSRELARIDCDVPLTVGLEDLKVQEPDWRAVRSLYRELEFKRLLRDLEEDDAAPATIGTAHPVRRVTTAKDQDALHRRLERAKTAAIACWPVLGQAGGEAGGSPLRAALLGIALDTDEAWVVQVDRESLRSASGRPLAAWLADPSRGKVSHDAKAVLRLLSRMGARLTGITGDTMIAAHLLNPARTTPTLTDLADEHLEVRVKIPEYVRETLDFESEDATQGCGGAARVVAQLHGQLAPTLNAQGLAELYQTLELPLLQVLAEMETAGIAIDVDYLNTLKASMDAACRRLTQELYTVAGATCNLNSPKQLAAVLFDQLKLPVIKRTKTGASTDSDVLRQLASRHPFPKRLLEYRELSKLMSTYVDALPKLVDPETGRVHTTFNQTATATGRLSSSNPNLQNIPIKTELGRQIRKAFIPGEQGWTLLAADYSQIELRILAHLSGDEQLIHAFANGHDIHRYTASLIYGVAENEVTPEMRSAMKAINFGILYGMSAHGLSRELGMPYDEAATFIQAYFERYPKVQGFFEQQWQHATRDGFVQTLLGRRRYIPEINSPDPAIRQLGQRLAMNTPMQGTAADLIKRAMVQVAEELRGRRMASRMLLQVHDELVFEAPSKERHALAALVRRVMEGAIALRVPLVVTIKTGPNWLEMTDLKNGTSDK